MSFNAVPDEESLSLFYNVIFILSFLVIWVATMALLSQYKYRIGKIKYYALTIIPLIYFIFPFHTYFANLLSPFVLNYPIAVSVTYTVLFSASKQVGAFLFSLSFLTASTIVPKDSVRKSLLISCIGMTILFSSVEITPLQYKVFPPYGLITEAFIPLGSFLLLVGIFTSAISFSQDMTLRNSIRKSVTEQSKLLDSIGTAEMEREVQKVVLTVRKTSAAMEENSGVEASMNESDMKDYVEFVIKELQSKKV
ncbi:MAG TPA: hypothetical protein VH415_11300 [Nitrososphaeraceae archaeon]